MYPYLYPSVKLTYKVENVLISMLMTCCPLEVLGEVRH
jgi:hypothetical protein